MAVIIYIKDPDVKTSYIDLEIAYLEAVKWFWELNMIYSISWYTNRAYDDFFVNDFISKTLFTADHVKNKSPSLWRCQK